MIRNRSESEKPGPKMVGIFDPPYHTLKKTLYFEHRRGCVGSVSDHKISIERGPHALQTCTGGGADGSEEAVGAARKPGQKGPKIEPKGVQNDPFFDRAADAPAGPGGRWGRLVGGLRPWGRGL